MEVYTMTKTDAHHVNYDVNYRINMNHHKDQQFRAEFKSNSF